MEADRDHDERGREVVVRLSGDLDHVGVATALRILERAARHASGPLVVDLADVEFLDSSGMRLLHRVRRDCGDRRLEFRLAGVHGRIRRHLEIAGILDA